MTERRSSLGTSARSQGRIAFARSRAVVGGDDPLDELVANDVVGAETDEADVLDPGKDVADHHQPRPLVARKVDLGDVAGHDHPRAKPQPRQEHLHLLGARVLRLIEDHEGVVKRVVRDEEVLRKVERVGGRDLDADGLRLSRRLDRIDEPHRAPAAFAAVSVGLPGKTEWLDSAGNADIEDECVGAVVDRPAVRPPRGASGGFSATPVRDSPKRADEEHDVVAQPLGARRVLDPARAAKLGDRDRRRCPEVLEARLAEPPSS